MNDSGPVKLGLALSGGGSRAIAYHLGCLRALHDLDLLGRVAVISSVSGGSVLAAHYCGRDETFEAFEARVKKLLAHGLQNRIFIGLFSWTGISAFCSFIFAVMTTAPLSVISAIASACVPSWRKKAALKRFFRHQRKRWATRTDVFERVLRREFGDVRMSGLPAGRPALIINAAELSTQTVFRFSRTGSGTWRSGTVEGHDFMLSEAVAASAAFPLLLPAIDREYVFAGADGRRRLRVSLTDGGVYDNLGIQAFDPNRPPRYAFGAAKVDIVIACVAESGLPSGDDFPLFLPARVRAAFATAHRQLHRLGMSALHEWQASGRLHAFIMPYLGQDDSKLPAVPNDATPPPLGELRDYPIDFAAMPPDAMEALIARGYAQTRRLAHAYLLPVLQSADAVQ